MTSWRPESCTAQKKDRKTGRRKDRKNDSVNGKAKLKPERKGGLAGLCEED